MSPNDADGMANGVDPDQTAPLGGSGIYTVCPDLFVQKFRIIMVILIKGLDEVNGCQFRCCKNKSLYFAVRILALKVPRSV